MDDMIGRRVWFPVEWEQGTLDSILVGNDREVIAYIIRRDDGRIFALDMQSRELEDYE